MVIAKSVLHNIGVLVVGFIFAFIGRGVDALFGVPRFGSPSITVIACISLLIGFLVRVWATDYFYKEHMSVIRLEPQKKLFTSGPYAFSRNPLYLGGNFFIFLGIILTAIGLIFTDVMIHREETQLAHDFGAEWADYKNRVRRWL
jgi:protein-S-isoprenylcysteine O-methyltransferase Ste14